MYFSKELVFGSALSKFRNFGGKGLNPSKSPLGTPLRRFRSCVCRSDESYYVGGSDLC
jgi:hypothetical protein